MKAFDSNTVEAVFNKSKGRCWYCGRSLDISSRAVSARTSEYFISTYVIDHFLPRKSGGTDDINNLVPACWSCNGIKRSNTLEEFRAIMTRLDNNVPKFSDEQMYYLAKIKIELPAYEPHLFWFEVQGLQP